jgi:hypothetical protein
MGRERVSEVLGRPRPSGPVCLQSRPDSRCLTELPKVAAPVVAVIHGGDWTILRSALLQLEGDQRTPQPARHGNGSLSAALGLSQVDTPRPARPDSQRPRGVARVAPEGAVLPPERGGLAEA